MIYLCLIAPASLGCFPGALWHSARGRNKDYCTMPSLLRWRVTEVIVVTSQWNVMDEYHYAYLWLSEHVLFPPLGKTPRRFLRHTLTPQRDTPCKEQNMKKMEYCNGRSWSTRFSPNIFCSWAKKWGLRYGWIQSSCTVTSLSKTTVMIAARSKAVGARILNWFSTWYRVIMTQFCELLRISFWSGCTYIKHGVHFRHS